MSHKTFPSTFPPQLDVTKCSTTTALVTSTPFNHSLLNGLYEMPETSRKSGSPTFRSKICAKTPNNNLVTALHPKLKSIYDYLVYAMKSHSKNNCFASKSSPEGSYAFKTCAEVSKVIDDFGSGLQDKDDVILSMFVPNCYEWFITDLSCIAYSIISTSLYEAFSRSHIEYILVVTKSPIMVLSHDKLSTILTIMYERKFTFLKCLIIKTSLGLENLQLLVSGSAHILPDTISKLRSMLNADFVQGYGLAESFSAITIGFNEDEYQPVTSGYICCTTELKLDDWPNIGFTWTKNRSGEILLRGPQIAQEYYKDPLRTQENYDAEGWLHTDGGKNSIDEALTVVSPFDRELLNGLFEVPKTQSKIGSPTFRNKLCANTPNHHLVTTLHPKLTSLYDYFQYASRRYSRNRCFAFKDSATGPYGFKTYAEVAKIRDEFGSGLVHLIKQKLLVRNHQLKMNREDEFILTIFVPNSYEWFITDLSCISYAITNSSLYDTLSRSHIEYILCLTKSPVMVLSHDNVLSILTVINESKAAFMKCLIVTDRKSIEECSSLILLLAKDLGITLYTFSDICRRGASQPLNHIVPRTNELYTISFTSGSVGNPKGVVLTHQNAISALVCIFSAAKKPVSRGVHWESSRALCVLPLSHVYQRIICFFELCVGATIYFPFNQGDSRQIMIDMYDVKPTHLIGVPRLFNRVEAGIAASIRSKGWVTRLIHKRAIEYKKDMFLMGEPITNHWLYDKAFTQKIRASLGLEHLELLVTGSALILPDTIRKLRSLLNVGFLQGYGLTESFASVTIAFNGDELNPVTSGFMSCTTEFKLKDCDEIGFTWAKNRSGRIFLRGPQVAQDYYKNPIKTQENYDIEGWFDTGDLGHLDKEGRMQIVDRVENIITLSLGYYVSPEEVENIYLQSCLPLLTQMYVYGESSRSFLVGVLVLNENECLNLLQEGFVQSSKSINYMDETNLKRLNLDVRLKRFILAHINGKVVASRLAKGFQQVKNIHLYFNNDNSAIYRRNQMENNGFTVKNGLLTPTLKIRRQDAKIFFKNSLKKMYNEGDIS
ncbi:hypothetical protein BABINDRAFT_11524 [Babjeviella inositovora NRRL Y-12698]|uniref:AMP-dependent synthetase/ligase domain-containing protein n=1 Tax=Babjeviella inositovora NRRL Y-12698 TaxID=984486 RepID=A0A1E3R021_9ASCO|nr:uncharacterized protein BABINDRAFT_11524 [Babjeviella inositovora NRRL Y-12698]ODQ83231.1 hypothetical protein BABINDRAFT_11524 [Babjeviella inositovora NRRL Y-12698]